MSDLELPAAAYLATLRLADSAFPTGLYTQSNALEAYAISGRVKKAEDVQNLLEDLLREQLATSDLIATAWAWQGASQNDGAKVREADAALEATKLCRELRESSRRSGGRLIALMAAQTQDLPLEALASEVRAGHTPGHNSAMTGAVGAVLGVPLQALLLMEANAFATSFVSAAMRLLPFDHAQAQAVLTALAPTLVELIDRIPLKHLRDMHSLSPQAEIMSMHHERDHVRLFAS
ncbi:urease accessory protein UreF [Halomonas sp. PR-M31]|uniref:urease accessory protein UreF n=1 Tax=Halomonas sp. PR-M31 TaxID=1471202 RepID=UPI0006524854|nr:urease accessory UreF family protein [Halomonas sp. PR-M31]